VSNRGGKCNFAPPPLFATVDAPIGLQQKRQEASQTSYRGERGCKIASSLSLKASATEERGGRERRRGAAAAREEAGRGGGPRGEGGAVEAGGGGGRPGRGGRARRRLEKRRCCTPASIPSSTPAIQAPPVVAAGSSCVGVGGELLRWWRQPLATSIWGRADPGEEEVAQEGRIPTRRRCRGRAEEVAREGRGRARAGKCDAVVVWASLGPLPRWVPGPTTRWALGTTWLALHGT
jgi:hypothetical protein